MLRYPVEDQTLHRCIAIAITQKRFIRSTLKNTLYEKGLYQDLHQELVTAAVEAWREGYNPDTDFRLIKNLTQRRLYAFLKQNGFRRGWNPHTKQQMKGYQGFEVFVSDLTYEKQK